MIRPQGQTLESPATPRDADEPGADAPPVTSPGRASQCTDSRADLHAEARLWTRYLVAREPTGYVTEKYVEFHERVGLACDPTSRRFDLLLLKLARRGLWRLAHVDSYTAVFYKHAALRKKLIVLVAILECTPPFCHDLDAAGRRSPLVTMAVMGARLAGHVLRAIGAAAALGPARWWCRLRSRGAANEVRTEVEGS